MEAVVIGRVEQTKAVVIEPVKITAYVAPEVYEKIKSYRPPEIYAKITDPPSEMMMECPKGCPHCSVDSRFIKYMKHVGRRYGKAILDVRTLTADNGLKIKIP